MWKSIVIYFIARGNYYYASFINHKDPITHYEITLIPIYE